MSEIGDAVQDPPQSRRVSARALRGAKEIVLQGDEDENHLRLVLDALPAAIYTTDANGRITYFNKAAVDLSGRIPVLGTDEWCVTWRLYLPDGTPLPHAECPMAVALRENRPVRGVEAVLERPDGTRIPFLPYPTPLRDPSGRLIGAVNMLVDISDRKLADNARAYLAAIVESSDDAIVSKSLQGIINSWNRGAERIFGYTAEEAVGRHISLLFPPDRLAEEDLIIDRIRRGERIDHFETVRRRKDGNDIDVSLTISPVHDHFGGIIGVSKIARDITDQKRAQAALHDLNENLERRIAERTRELAAANERLMTEAAERERAEMALVQSQKMEAIGQLASGMAHDFNNLLTAILGNLELVEMRVHDERLRNTLQAASRAALRGAKLNEQMLAFSRKQHLVPRPIDIKTVIGDMREMLDRTLGGTVRVVTAIPADIWSALVDPTQFELVVFNLAINARDAMPSGGVVRISGRNVSPREIRPEAGLTSGEYVCVAVSDDGVGMSEEVRARACEPFFTTKEPGKGTGLGLAQVYGLARQSGGGLVIDSTPGQGTTIEIYLPRSIVSGMAARKRGAGPRRRQRGGIITVLVVDDQPDVREVAAAHLEALGYQVVQSGSSRTALALLGDRDTIDLLIADYAMAGTNGVELALAARAKRPDLPIVIMTGYVDVNIVDAQLPEAQLLKKPFRISDLALAVERVLRRGEGEADSGKIVSLRRASRAAGNFSAAD